MFLSHTNPKLCVLVNAIVLDICKITELKKKAAKKKFLQKEFEKEFFILWGFEII